MVVRHIPKRVNPLSSWTQTVQAANAVTDIRFTFRNELLNICSSIESSCLAPPTS